LTNEYKLCIILEYVPLGTGNKVIICIHNESRLILVFPMGKEARRVVNRLRRLTTLFTSTGE